MRKVANRVLCVKFSLDPRRDRRRMSTEMEVEFLYACEALSAARDAARPDLALIAALREQVRVAQRALWAQLDGEQT